MMTIVVVMIRKGGEQVGVVYGRISVLDRSRSRWPAAVWNKNGCWMVARRDFGVGIKGEGVGNEGEGVREGYTPPQITRYN